MLEAGFVCNLLKQDVMGGLLGDCYCPYVASTGLKTSRKYLNLLCYLQVWLYVVWGADWMVGHICQVTQEGRLGVGASLKNGTATWCYAAAP